MSDVKLTDNKELFINAKSKAIERALEAVGLQAEGYAKLELENTPRRVDTGRLRASISHTAKRETAYIGTNVEYAIYVHEGTMKMEKNQFLRNAVEKHIAEYKNITEEYLKNAP
jgi:HK97 gp10 family phage protein